MHPRAEAALFALGLPLSMQLGGLFVLFNQNGTDNNQNRSEIWFNWCTPVRAAAQVSRFGAKHIGLGLQGEERSTSVPSPEYGRAWALMSQPYSALICKLWSLGGA